MDLKEFYDITEKDVRQLETTLSEMKAQGKEKTVRYKELYGEKFILIRMLERMKKYCEVK